MAMCKHGMEQEWCSICSPGEREDAPIADSIHDKDLKEELGTSPGCYCNSSYADIYNDIRRGSIPEEALVRGCCWKAICKVRETRKGDILLLYETTSDPCRLTDHDKTNSDGYAFINNEHKGALTLG